MPKQSTSTAGDRTLSAVELASRAAQLIDARSGLAGSGNLAASLKDLATSGSGLAGSGNLAASLKDLATSGSGLAGPGNLAASLKDLATSGSGLAGSGNLAASLNALATSGSGLAGSGNLAASLKDLATSGSGLTRPHDAIPIRTVGYFGTVVKAVRQRRGLTQQQLADAAGVGRRFLSELENGKPTLEFDKVLKTAIAVGIDLLARPR